MNVSLVMFKTDGTRRDFPLTKDRVVIGRTNDCDLRIPLSSVSREHCEIRLENGAVELHDLGSSNGTFHNDRRVTESMLSAGDLIGVGPVVLTVVIDGQPATVKFARMILDPEASKPRGIELPPAHKQSDDGKSVPPLGLEPEEDTPFPKLDESSGTAQKRV